MRYVVVPAFAAERYSDMKLVSDETANRAPFTLTRAELPPLRSNLCDWIVLDKNGREYNRWWGGNTRAEVDAGIDRLNTACAEHIMTKGTAAEEA